MNSFSVMAGWKLSVENAIKEAKKILEIAQNSLQDVEHSQGAEKIKRAKNNGAELIERAKRSKLMVTDTHNEAKRLREGPWWAPSSVWNYIHPLGTKTNGERTVRQKKLDAVLKIEGELKAQGISDFIHPDFRPASSSLDQSENKGEPITREGSLSETSCLMSASSAHTYSDTSPEETTILDFCHGKYLAIDTSCVSDHYRTDRLFQQLFTWGGGASMLLLSYYYMPAMIAEIAALRITASLTTAIGSGLAMHYLKAGDPDFIEEIAAFNQDIQDRDSYNNKETCSAAAAPRV